MRIFQRWGFLKREKIVKKEKRQHHSITDFQGKSETVEGKKKGCFVLLKARVFHVRGLRSFGKKIARKRRRGPGRNETTKGT